MRAWFLFRLERLALKGPLATVWLVLGLLAGIALVGGLLSWLFDRDDFDSLGEALWWAVLRVSDPGYLEDDGTAGRPVAISLILSLSGAAFLIGGVAAVMTQWLTATLHQLAQGRTPVSYRDHFVVVGWTDRTPHLIGALLEAEPRGRVVLLLPEVEDAQRSELRAALPRRKTLDRVILRSGLPTRPDHLQRASCSRARAVVLPELAVADDATAHGPRWLRSLAALRRVLEDLPPQARPRVVVEVGLPELTPRAAAILPEAELVDGDRIAARALARDVLAGAEASRALDVLVMGRGRLVPTLLEELRAHLPAGSSVVPVEQGAEEAVADDLAQGASGREDRGYDRAVLVADRGRGDREHADEETLAVAFGLMSGLGAVREGTRALVELLDPASADILAGPDMDHTFTSVEVARALAEAALG